jgi:2',3'-cyclic-nucleotide 2'-phosphodiesterase (5'-nucleotidase family)
MGNREFHYLRPVQRWREQEMSFPLLAANLRDLRSPSGTWQSHTLVDWAGQRLALVGLTVVQYPVGSAWERLTGFRFYPPEKSLSRLLPHLEGEVVLMSHLGLKEDRRLASLFPHLRLILSAHSHDTLAEPERVGGCMIVQGGSHGRFVGEITSSGWPDLRWKLHKVPS